MISLVTAVIFQSTRPARGATHIFDGDLVFIKISIHAPREGRDEIIGRSPAALKIFQSTRPARGATHADLPSSTIARNFNPRAPRGARPSFACARLGCISISIHAPREGRDAQRKPSSSQPKISIHAPREGRDGLRALLRDSFLISIHAPREGRDKESADNYAKELEKFQSTRPARGATAKVNKFLRTFLQKRHGFQIFLRKTLPFKAFCRLQIGKNFSICGANRCGNFCELLLRTIRSSVLPEGRSACSQNAQFYSHTFSRDNRNADCLFPDP